MKKTGLKDYCFSTPVVMCGKVTPDDKPQPPLPITLPITVLSVCPCVSLFLSLSVLSPSFHSLCDNIIQIGMR